MGITLSTWKNSRRHEFRHGFTLIEVLISVVILSIGIVAALQAFNISLFALGASRDALRATMLIRGKMAELEMSVLEQGGIEPGSSSGRFLGANADFCWELQVGQVPRLAHRETGGSEIGTDALNEVVVTVWRKDSDRRYSVVTYVRTEKGQD